MTVDHEHAALRDELQRQLKSRLLWGGFRPSLEVVYEQHHLSRHRDQFQVGFWLGMGLFALFGVLDVFLVGAHVGPVLGMRAIGILALLSLFLWWRRSHDFSLEHYQRLLWGFTLLMAMTLDGVVMFSPPDVRDLYFMGVIVLWMYSFVLLRMRFAHCFWTILACVAMHNLAVGVVNPAPVQVVVAHNLFLAGSGVVLLAANFLIESSERLNFLQSHLLKLQKAELETANDRLAELSARDPLTGLSNRRHLEGRLQEEWRRAVRHQHPVGLLVIDIDAFKQYNDTYGHTAGDECLRQVAAILGSSGRRPGDLVARFGGEEFVIVWPACSLEDITAEAVRLREQVEHAGLKHEASRVAPHVTISVGVACRTPGAHNTHEQLFEAADEALYRAKRLGRNRIEVAGPDPLRTHLSAGGQMQVS